MSSLPTSSAKSTPSYVHGTHAWLTIRLPETKWFVRDEWKIGKACRDSTYAELRGISPLSRVEGGFEFHGDIDSICTCRRCASLLGWPIGYSPQIRFDLTDRLPAWCKQMNSSDPLLSKHVRLRVPRLTMTAHNAPSDSLLRAFATILQRCGYDIDTWGPDYPHDVVVQTTSDKHHQSQKRKSSASSSAAAAEASTTENNKKKRQQSSPLAAIAVATTEASTKENNKKKARQSPIAATTSASSSSSSQTPRTCSSVDTAAALLVECETRNKQDHGWEQKQYASNRTLSIPWSSIQTAHKNQQNGSQIATVGSFQRPTAVFTCSPTTQIRRFWVQCQHCQDIHTLVDLNFCAMACISCGWWMENPLHVPFHTKHQTTEEPLCTLPERVLLSEYTVPSTAAFKQIQPPINGVHVSA